MKDVSVQGDRLQISFYWGDGLHIAAQDFSKYNGFPVSRIDPVLLPPVLGGIGIIPGAVLGGIVIGLVESFTTSYISSSMADTFVFLILIIVLVIKPAGILGKNVGEKV